MYALAGMAMAMLMAPGSAASVSCDSDRLFMQAGWVVHDPAKFNGVLHATLRRIMDENAMDYTSTLSIYNEAMGKLVNRVAFDKTALLEHGMGDGFVLFTDAETYVIYEVRWLDGTTKHLAHSAETCANLPLPWAYTSTW